METYISLGFFGAAFAATVASIALSFSKTTEWSVAMGAVAVLFAAAGLFFALWDWGKPEKKG